MKRWILKVRNSDLQNAFPPLRGLYNCDIPSSHSNKSTKSLKPLGCIKVEDMLIRSTANFNCSDIGQSSVNISKYIFRQMFMHGK